MSGLLGFAFDAVGGRALLATVGIAALLAWWQLERVTLRNEGASHARTEIDRSSAELADKGRAARDAVDRGDPHQRLRQRWCLDCGPGGGR